MITPNGLILRAGYMTSGRIAMVTSKSIKHKPRHVALAMMRRGCMSEDEQFHLVMWAKMDAKRLKRNRKMRNFIPKKCLKSSAAVLKRSLQPRFKRCFQKRRKSQVGVWF